MKPLLPTLKEKKRYIGFELVAQSIPSAHEIKGALMSGLKGYMGDLGLAKAGFAIISLSKEKGILRVAPSYVNDIKAGMILIDKIHGQDIIIRSVSTSGTLASVRKKLNGETS